MKNIITFLILISFPFIGYTQNSSFVDKYQKIVRTHSDGEQSLMVSKLNEKEIRKYILSKNSENNDLDKKMEAFIKQMKSVSSFMSDNNLLSIPQASELLESYGKLASIENKDIEMQLRAQLKKNKIKELIVILHLKNDINMFSISAISFKKPILLSDYVEDPSKISKLFSINESEENKSNALISLNYNYEEKFDSPYPRTEAMYNSTPFRLDIIKENGKYGVKMFSDRGEQYIILPRIDKEPVLYGSNPGNTYVITEENDNDYYLLYDKFGFTASHGNEIKPVYIPGSKEVAFFIIRWSDRYGLYECPEKYEMIRDENFGLRPPYGYRLVDCRSIIQKDDNTLECVKADGVREFISIRNE